ncbi:hypothetical protein D3C81_931660 [compost metagenome]
MGEEAAEGVTSGLGQVQFAAAGFGDDVLLAPPQAEVVVAAAAHAAGGRLGHEAGAHAEFVGDLAADQAVGDQAVGGQFAGIEHPVQFELARVLVVALDHVQAHGAGVLHHALEDRPHRLQVAQVVGGAGAGAHLHFQLVAEPGHLRFAAGLQAQPGVGDERLVAVDQQAARVGGEDLAADLRAMVGLVETAEEGADRGVPGQHIEAADIRQRGEFGGLCAAAEQHAGAGALQVGERRAVKLHAFLQVAQQVLGRHHLGDHPAAEGDHLVVDVFHAGLADAGIEVLGDCGAGVVFFMKV